MPWLMVVPGNSGPLVRPGLPLLGPPIATEGKPPTAGEPLEYDRHLPSSLLPNHAKHAGPAVTSAPTWVAVVAMTAGAAAAATANAPTAMNRRVRRLMDVTGLPLWTRLVSTRNPC